MKSYFAHTNSSRTAPALDVHGSLQPTGTASFSRAFALTGIAVVVLALMALTGCKDAGKTGTSSSSGTGSPPPLSAPPSAPADTPPASSGGMSAPPTQAPSPSDAASAPAKP